MGERNSLQGKLKIDIEKEEQEEEEQEEEEEEEEEQEMVMVVVLEPALYILPPLLLVLHVNIRFQHLPII